MGPPGPVMGFHLPFTMYVKSYHQYIQKQHNSEITQKNESQFGDQQIRLQISLCSTYLFLQTFHPAGTDNPLDDICFWSVPVIEFFCKQLISNTVTMFILRYH
jgi:hypothetical protein